MLKIEDNLRDIIPLKNDQYIYFSDYKINKISQKIVFYKNFF